jgi:hypothetical protein
MRRPRGASGRPASHSKVVSSGATMPARAPASIDMLHRVMRPSIDSARIASPAYSMTCPVRARRADAGDHGQDDVLGRHARAQAAVDGDAQRARLALPQRLRGQHVRHLGGADAEGQRAQRAVRGRVAVAADDHLARQAQALLRADHVHDALAHVVQAEEADARSGAVVLQRLRHRALLGVGDVGERTRTGGHVVVGRGEGALGAAHRKATLAQHLEGRRRAVLHQVPVDVEQALSVVALRDDVGLPDLVEQR